MGYAHFPAEIVSGMELMMKATGAGAGKFGVKGQCQYVHLLREVLDSVTARQCQLAVLVPPASMTHVEQIAGNLEKMPPIESLELIGVGEVGQALDAVLT